jgi:hypothetical protein
MASSTKGIDSLRTRSLPERYSAAFCWDDARQGQSWEACQEEERVERLGMLH